MMIQISNKFYESNFIQGRNKIVQKIALKFSTPLWVLLEANNIKVLLLLLQIFANFKKHQILFETNK